MDNSELAMRMKEYERRNQSWLQKRTPVVIRVDMRAGHTFTRGFDRPFDMVYMKSIQETMKYMCENIQGVKCGYSESDEITLVLVDYDKLTTSAWFDYRTDKLCSISASLATLGFNRFFAKNVEEYRNSKEVKGYQGQSFEEYEKAIELLNAYNKALELGAMFDSRCFNLPKEEVANCIYWRQLDASRNSIQMVGQANFSHSQLQNKTCNDIQSMLLIRRDINWNNFPTDYKRGAACRKVAKTVNIAGTMDEISSWEIDREMPLIKNDRDYIEKLIYV